MGLDDILWGGGICNLLTLQSVIIFVVIKNSKTKSKSLLWTGSNYKTNTIMIIDK